MKGLLFHADPEKLKLEVESILSSQRSTM